MQKEIWYYLSEFLKNSYHKLNHVLGYNITQFYLVRTKRKEYRSSIGSGKQCWLPIELNLYCLSPTRALSSWSSLCAGATDTSAVAPKFSDILILYQPDGGGADSAPPFQEFPYGYSLMRDTSAHLVILIPGPVLHWFVLGPRLTDQSQREVLIPVGKRFKVTEKQENDDGTWDVYLDCIAN